MKVWWQEAKPHRDVLSGELTEDRFAANLWKVRLGEAPKDYQDAELFFRRTHLTQGMKALIKEVMERLIHSKGNSVITLQTPFGGGKTHTLITLWHFFKNSPQIRYLESVRGLLEEMCIGELPDVAVAVFVGDAVDPLPKEPPFTPMGMLMEQLEVYDEVRRYDEEGIPPGAEKLQELLSKRPTLILLDELANYSAALYEKRDLGALHVFWQQLTVAAQNAPHCVVVATLPTSAPYGQAGEAVLRQLQQIFGRMQRIYAPVQGEEIYEVIRRRLFERLGDESVHRQVASEYFELYQRKGNLVPKAVREVAYRERMVKAYPFHPLLIDLLRERWGTIEGFQRTRGVLRFLAQVVRDLYGKSHSPLIHPGEVDLSGEARGMLLSVIESRYESVLAADITDGTAHAKQLDEEIGEEFSPLHLATQLATTIFLSSHHGARREGEEEEVVGLKRGIEREWLRVSVWHPDAENAPVDEVLLQLQKRCWYLDEQEGLLFFGLWPSLEKILQDEEERVTEEEVEEALREALETATRANTFRPFIFPERSRDIPDDASLKLVVIGRRFTYSEGGGEETERIVREFWENCGESPRVHKNTLFFVVASERELEDLCYGPMGLRRKVAIERVRREKLEELDKRRRLELEENLQEIEKGLPMKLLNAFRWLAYPRGGRLEWVDIGIASVGEASLSQRVRRTLEDLSIGKLISTLTPQKLVSYTFREEREKSVKDVIKAFAQFPHLPAVASNNVVLTAVKKGVGEGVFALRRGGQVLLLQAVPDPAEDDEIVRWLERGELTPEHVRRLMVSEKRMTMKALRERLDKLIKNEKVLQQALEEGERKGLWKVERGIVIIQEESQPPCITVEDLLEVIGDAERAEVKNALETVRGKRGREVSEEEFRQDFMNALRDLLRRGDWRLEVDGKTVSPYVVREGEILPRVLERGMLCKVSTPPVQRFHYQLNVSWDKLGQLGQTLVQLVRVIPDLKESLCIEIVMKANVALPEEQEKRFEEALSQLGICFRKGNEGDGG